MRSLLRPSCLVFMVAIAMPQFAWAKRIETLETPISEAKPLVKDLCVISQHTDGDRNYTVCVSSNGVKFVCGNIALLAHGPDWRVSILNERTKKFFQLPPSDFKGLAAVERFDVKQLKVLQPGSKEKPVLIEKHPVVTVSGKPELSPEKVKKMGFEPTSIEVSASTDIKVNKSALNILGQLYAIDGLSGIPMKIEMLTGKGERIECLSTEWCLNREETPLFFDVPKTFKVVQNQAEVEAMGTPSTNRQLQEERDSMSSTRNAAIEKRKQRIKPNASK